MHKLLTIERETPAPDDFHAGDSVWTEVLDVWADFKKISGAEVVANSQQRGHFTHTVSIRWSPEVADMDSRDRLIVKGEGRTLEVLSAINRAEDNHWIDLVCKERVS